MTWEKCILMDDAGAHHGPEGDMAGDMAPPAEGDMPADMSPPPDDPSDDVVKVYQ